MGQDVGQDMAGGGGETIRISVLVEVESQWTRVKAWNLCEDYWMDFLFRVSV